MAKSLRIGHSGQCPALFGDELRKSRTEQDIQFARVLHRKLQHQELCAFCVNVPLARCQVAIHFRDSAHAGAQQIETALTDSTVSEGLALVTFRRPTIGQFDKDDVAQRPLP